MLPTERRTRLRSSRTMCTFAALDRCVLFPPFLCCFYDFSPGRCFFLVDSLYPFVLVCCRKISFDVGVLQRVFVQFVILELKCFLVEKIGYRDSWNENLLQ